jgi:hypothetical protein
MTQDGIGRNFINNARQPVPYNGVMAGWCQSSFRPISTMTSQRTAHPSLHGSHPPILRTARYNLPLFADCMSFDKRIERVRSPGVLDNGSKPISLAPRCIAVWPAFFGFQLNRLYKVAKRSRLTAAGETDNLTMPSSCKDIRMSLLCPLTHYLL